MVSAKVLGKFTQESEGRRQEVLVILSGLLANPNLVTSFGDLGDERTVTDLIVAADSLVTKTKEWVDAGYDVTTEDKFVKQ